MRSRDKKIEHGRGSRLGISEVVAVIAVLGITLAAVGLFWASTSGLFAPQINKLVASEAIVSASTGAATVTVTNQGTTQVLIEAVTYQGSASGSLSVTATTLKPGQSMSVQGTASGLVPGESVTFRVQGRVGSASGNIISAQLTVIAGI